MDPEDETEADVMKHVLQSDLEDPHLRYQAFRKGVCKLGLACRLGIGVADFNPRIGPSGRRTLRVGNPVNFHWTPGWANPHELDCPDAFESRRMRIRDIVAMESSKWGKWSWENTIDVRPDRGQLVGRTGDPSLPAGAVRLSENSEVPGVRAVDDPNNQEATVVLRWRKVDPDDEEPEENREPEALEPEDRYLACPVCGYHEKPADGSMLDEIGGLCPRCSDRGEPNLLHRIDVGEPEEQGVYRQGIKRLTIIAPYSHVVLYDGPPPWNLRSVPWFVWQPYEHPLEPVGMSDTALDMTLQSMSDSITRHLYEQISQSKRIFGLVEGPDDSMITDARGYPFTFSDENGYTMFAQSEDVLERGIREFQPTAVAPGVIQALQAVQNLLMRDMGTGDLDIGAENSKDIPVGTANILVETGEIPVDDHKVDFQADEGLFLGVFSDMLIATRSEEDWVAVAGPDGKTVLRQFKTRDIPSVHVRVVASPQMKKIAAGEAQEMIQILQQPPPIRNFLARQYNVSQQDLKQLEKEMDDWEKAQQAQQSMIPPQGGLPQPSPQPQMQPGAVGPQIMAGAPH